MGKIPNGITGALSGKVGPVVGSVWLGINTLRSVPKERSTPATPAEEAQLGKFSLISAFLRPMRALLDIGFRDFAIKKKGAHAAQSYGVKNAVIGTYPDIGVLCDAVLVCRGDLPGVAEASAESTLTGHVSFKWNAGLLRGKATDEDKAILVVLCHELDHCVYTITGAPRVAGSDILKVHGFSGKEVQTWLSFASKDGKDIAPSIFTGQFIVA